MSSRPFAGFFGLIVIAASTAATAGGLSGREPAGQQIPVYRAGVDLVVVNVAVLDDDGEPVLGLTADDFRVAEDGVTQELSLFASSTNSPLDVALVLDVSASVAHNAPTIKEHARAFLAALSPEDCVYFVPFREAVFSGTWAAPNEPGLLERVEMLSLEGGTALYDALGRALGNIDRTRYASLPGEENGPGARFDGPLCGSRLPPPNLGIPGSVRRTAVVVLSDGGDEHSLSTYADTLVGSWSGTVPIFSVAVGDALEPRRRGAVRPGSAANERYRVLYERSRGLQNRLGQLARVTGGRLVLGRGRDRVREAFDEVITMLRSSYLVGYNAPPDSAPGGPAGLSWHAIDLRIPGRDVQIFRRPGYYRSRFDTVGAARIVRGAPALIQKGKHRDAIEQLDLAIRLDPGYWPIYLQRARALLEEGRVRQAHADLLYTLELRPGLGSVHELVAGTALDLGEWESAWYHAIRAAQDGVDVTPIFVRLAGVSEAPEDLAAQMRAVKVFVDVGPGPEALDQGSMLELLRRVRHEISAASDLALVAESSIANAALMIEVEKVEGMPRKLEGELVLYAGGYEALRAEKLEIDDLDNPGDLATGVAEAARKLRTWIAEERR